MDMGDRLKELRLQKGATQEEVGKVIGVAKATIMKYEKGLVENLKRSSIEKLANYFGVAPSYLMCLDEPKSDALGNPVTTIPILGIVKAGYDYLAQENWTGTIDIDKSLVGNGEDYFALRVHGNSMSPVLVEDDIVIVKKQDDFENGQIVVVLINGEEATIKKAYKGTTGIELKAINPYYPPRIFSKDEIKEIPVSIIGIVKELKRVF